MKKEPARQYEAARMNTRRMFAEALKKLMTQKPLEKISVQALADECGVNRKTFYYHFDSMEDLLWWMLENEASEVFRDVELREMSNDPIELLEFIIQYCDKNRKMLRVVFRDTDIGLKRLQLYGGFHRVVQMSVEKAEQTVGCKISEKYRAYLTDFYLGALGHSFYQYIYERTPGTQAEMIEYSRRMLTAGITAAVTAEGVQ